MKPTLAWAPSLPLLAVLLAAGAGCDQGAPPLDQLPLRDTLRAEPEVVAALPDDARQRLAARFHAARAADTSDQPVDDADGTPPDVLVARIDRLRESRGQDAQVTSAIGAGVVHPVTGEPAGMVEPVPAPDGTGASPVTASLEARAISTLAGAPLRALMAASGARHLQRVVGWPVGAVAAGDTIYVNAAWLVALAPDNPDGGPASEAPARAAGTRAAPASQYDGVPVPPPNPDAGAAPADRGDAGTGAGDAGGRPVDGGATRTPAVDAGAPRPAQDAGPVYVPPVTTYPPTYPPSTPTTPPPPVDDGAACAAACDTSSSGGDDCSSSSDGSDDSCQSSSDGSDDSCQSSSDSGAACESADDENGCQIARGRRHGGNGRLLTLVAPLAFLLPRRRRS